MYTPIRRATLATAAVCGCFATMPIFAAKHGIETPSSISVDAIPVCFDFGCKTRDTVSLSLTQWAKVGDIFLPEATTPQQEREQIGTAVGAMETLIGLYTPTHNDLAFGLPKDDTTAYLPGQLDCIDEAVNTTTYLRLFEQSGFLKHHAVIEQSYRRSFFIQHWAGQLQERISQKRWSVDAWFHPNGHPPIIQETESWQDLSLLSYLKKQFRRKRH